MQKLFLLRMLIIFGLSFSFANPMMAMDKANNGKLDEVVANPEEVLCSVKDEEESEETEENSKEEKEAKQKQEEKEAKQKQEEKAKLEAKKKEEEVKKQEEARLEKEKAEQAKLEEEARLKEAEQAKLKEQEEAKPEQEAEVEVKEEEAKLEQEQEQEEEEAKLEQEEEAKEKQELINRILKIVNLSEEQKEPAFAELNKRKFEELNNIIGKDVVIINSQVREICKLNTPQSELLKSVRALVKNGRVQAATGTIATLIIYYKVVAPYVLSKAEKAKQVGFMKSLGMYAGLDGQTWKNGASSFYGATIGKIATKWNERKVSKAAKKTQKK